MYLCEIKKGKNMFIHTLFTKLNLGQRKFLFGERLKQLGQLAFKRRWEIIHKNQKKVGRFKISIILIFRLHELGEVHPNYKMENLKGNSFPALISLVIIELSLKSRICAELKKNYKLVWQFLCSLTDDNLRVTIRSFKCQGVGSTVSH